MEEVEMQKQETAEEVKEVRETNVEEEQKGFALAEVVTSTDVVIIHNGKQVAPVELIAALAKFAEDQLGFKY